MKRPLLATAVATLAATAALTGCSFSFHAGSTTPTLSKDTLATNVKAKLAEGNNGTPPDQVICKGDLEGKVGATQECALEAGGDWLPVTVTVTKVDGSTIGYNYEVGTTGISEPDW